MRSLALGLALAFGSAAAQFGVYSGTIGSYPVVVRLDRNDAENGGAYSYTSRGLDLTLGVKVDGGTVTLTEYAPNTWESWEPKAAATFTGQVRGATLSGTWRTTDGKSRLPFTLRRVNVTTVPLALPNTPGLRKLRAEDPYSFLKLNRAWPTVRTEGTIQWVREPLSGVTYPRLPGNTAVNGTLQDRQLLAANGALQCRSDLGGKGTASDDGWHEEVKVTYRSATLLGVRFDVTYYCGGAHPDGYTDGLILDVKTGRALRLTDLWPNATATFVNTTYLRAYPRKSEKDCLDLLQRRDAVRPEDYAAILSKTGVILWPTVFPHAAAACAEEVTVPFSTFGRGSNLAPR